MNNGKKYNVLIILGLFVLIVMIGGLTYAFFNYTKTGDANVLKVGEIRFNSDYTAINLTNVFPISKTNIDSDTDNVMTITIDITGKTTYQGGIDYKVTAVNVNNQVDGLNIPIGIRVSQENLNTNDNEISLYSYEDGKILEEDAEFVVGHIKKDNDTDGSITIKAYFDKEYIAITDTIDESYQWADDRTIFTTSEWNSLNDEGLSFKIKVEAYEGKDRLNANVIVYNKNGVIGETPERQILTGSNDTILGDIDTFGFLGWAETADAEEATYEVGDEINFNTSKTLYAVIKTPAEILTNDYEEKACMAAYTMEETEPYQGNLNDGKVIYYTGNDEKTEENPNGCLANYVWYSGKLWRIVAIYPDGKMKLVTENAMTTISYGETVTFANSYVDQWLTEEFLPTLYNNKNIVVQNAQWNAKQNLDEVNPYSISNRNDISNRPVGLLNAYEYFNTITSGGWYAKNLSTWFLDSQNASKIRCIMGTNNGLLIGSYDPREIISVRPSVYFQSNVIFSEGDGTINNPYIIRGDKEVAMNGSNLTSRANGINGEYVKFDNEIYRIIGQEGTTVKIVKADFIKEQNTIIKKKFAATSDFGDNTSFNDEYWNYYLLNTWYNGIQSTYKDMIATITNSLVQGELAGKYYRKILVNSDYKNVFSTNIDEYYYSKIGLLRYGEIFASQLFLEKMTSLPNDASLWLITPSSSGVLSIAYFGRGGFRNISNSVYAVRPTLNLKSTVKITCDNNNGYTCDGTYFRPYDLYMD